MTDKADIKPILIKPSTAARLLDISRPYCYKMLKKGLLRQISWEIDGSKVVRIALRDVLEFIESHKT